MLNIYLNRVAIWKPVGRDRLDIRRSPAGQPYLTKDSLVFKQSDEPLLRLVKNYSTGKKNTDVKFSLFVRTDRDDIEALENELDEFAKTITPEFAKSSVDGATIENFVYTDYFIKDKEIQL